MEHDDLKSQTLYSGSAANAPQSPATSLAEHIIGNKATKTLPSRLLTTPPHLQTPLSCADANAAAFPGKKDIALTSDPAETGAAALFCFNESNCKLWTAGDNAACMESVNFDVVIVRVIETRPVPETL